MLPDPQAFADVIVLAVKTAIAPLEAENKALRDQVAADAQRRGAYETSIARDLLDMAERVRAVEVRAPIPGPAGEPGPPGRDGKDGEPGSPGLEFAGVYIDGKEYGRGQLATWAGSLWHCNDATSSRPGDGSKAWTLCVKRGRDGKDVAK